MKKQALVLLFAAALLYGCNPSAKNENVDDRNGLSQGQIRMATFGKCDTAANGKGVSVKVEVWEPADSTEVASEIRNLIAAKLIDRVNQHGDSASIAANRAAGTTLEGAFNVFQRNYNDFKKDFPDAPGCWEVGLKGDTVMVTPKVLFYQLDHYSFTGGAHPNTFRSFHAFDATNGAEVEMKKFVADSTALLQLVERHFRKTEKLTSDIDLEEAGYFLLNHQFVLPVNYVFTPKGVLFYYNPYEIAAYARGAIQFTISYEELGDIIRKKEVM
ncbi:DUF3298 domain-containing protein [Dyadobacter sp.]|uniref:DUF3298 and DUF4163 domain-containing protein n=1 Tax=Dyadobacter sp. TaxID=1914288 RepID=UPI003F71BC6E